MEPICKVCIRVTKSTAFTTGIYPDYILEIESPTKTRLTLGSDSWLSIPNVLDHLQASGVIGRMNIHSSTNGSKYVLDGVQFDIDHDVSIPIEIMQEFKTACISSTRSINVGSAPYTSTSISAAPYSTSSAANTASWPVGSTTLSFSPPSTYGVINGNTLKTPLTAVKFDLGNVFEFGEEWGNRAKLVATQKLVAERVDISNGMIMAPSQGNIPKPAPLPSTVYQSDQAGWLTLYSNGIAYLVPAWRA